MSNIKERVEAFFFVVVLSCKDLRSFTPQRCFSLMSLRGKNIGSPLLFYFFTYALCPTMIDPTISPHIMPLWIYSVNNIIWLSFIKIFYRNERNWWSLIGRLMIQMDWTLRGKGFERRNNTVALHFLFYFFEIISLQKKRYKRTTPHTRGPSSP